MASLGLTPNTTEYLVRQVVAYAKVLRPGMVGQIAAGRDLTVADFTSHGMATPRALWNFTGGALTDASGNGFTLTNGGAVTFDKGINGVANEAARFSGAATAYLTAANSIKMPYGSIGMWVKLNRNAGGIISTWQDATAVGGFRIGVVATTGRLQVLLGTNSGDLLNYWDTGGRGRKRIDDGAWHFITVTWDGGRLVVYVDGRVDVTDGFAQGTPTRGPMFQPATAPMVLGCFLNPTASAFFQGWIDEIFVTEQVLKLEQHRWLYAAKVPYTLSPQPKNIGVFIERYLPNGSLVSADFSTQPLLGYNFDAVAGITIDNYGSLGRTLTAAAGTPTSAPDVDGSKGGSVNMLGGTHYTASDTSLPAGTSSSTIGGWMQVNDLLAAFRCLLSYGNRRSIYYTITSGRGYFDASLMATGIDAGDFYEDGRWHFLVGVTDSTAFDGALAKLYIDGRLVGFTTAALGTTTLSGATGFRIGAGISGADNVNGNIATAFVCGYAMTTEEIFKLYVKQGAFLDRAPLDAAAHIEGFDATNIYVINDTLDPRSSLEFSVL